MEIEKDFYLTFGKNVDVTKLTYNEMMYFQKHNVHLFIKSLIEVKIKNNGKN